MVFCESCRNWINRFRFLVFFPRIRNPLCKLHGKQILKERCYHLFPCR